MSLVNAKEEKLMNGESSKKDNTQNNKVETEESLAKKNTPGRRFSKYDNEFRA